MFQLVCVKHGKLHEKRTRWAKEKDLQTKLTLTLVREALCARLKKKKLDAKTKATKAYMRWDQV